jgi:hypothetical protein
MASKAFQKSGSSLRRSGLWRVNASSAWSKMMTNGFPVWPSLSKPGFSQSHTLLFRQTLQ